MGIISLFASLFGIGCSDKNIQVEFIDSKTKKVIAVSRMAPDQLPDTFAIDTSFELDGKQWSVISAEPVHKKDFVSSGKLRVMLSQLQTMAPGDLLYSLATISDDLGAVAGEMLPGAEVFSIHEDDWRQIEFISTSFSKALQQEQDDIRAIYTQETNKVGFKKIHIRKRIPQPMEANRISLSALESLFKPGKKYVGVGFHRTRGIVPGSFAWNVDPTLTLWGTTNQTGHVTFLCLAGTPEPASIELISDKLATTTREHALILVDWCRLEQLSPDPQAFSKYFHGKNH